MSKVRHTERTVGIDGMHCASCEVLLERRLRKVDGVRAVSVDRAKGCAAVSCDSRVPDSALAKAVRDAGYAPTDRPSTRRHAAELGAALLIVLALYLVARQFDLAKTFGVTDEMSLGFVFVLGLVASVSSCLAVTGGLLVALSASYAKAFPQATRREQLRPVLFFNIGRVIGYTVLGGAIGLLGSAFTLSTRTAGVLTIIASAVMILLGLQLVGVPYISRLQLRVPKRFAHKLYDASSTGGSFAAAGIGAATFVLPCGFTQALQLYVFATGSAVAGSLTMLAFSLGTMPALLGAGALTTTTKGSTQRVILAAAGIAVIGLGLFNATNGLALSGVDVRVPLTAAAVAPAALAEPTAEGKQVVRMRVVGYEYEPSRFTIVQGVPVEWVIDASQAAGCARVLAAPSLGITEFLSANRETTITFTPAATGTIPFSCTMAMTTPGAQFTVVENPDGPVAVEPQAPKAPSRVTDLTGCDPQYAMCFPPQELSMEVSRERGFYPNQFTVAFGEPVELTIDAKVAPGGCMSTLLIPALDVAHQMRLGETKVRFTPTQRGTFPITCSMGSQWGYLTVV